MKSGKDLYSSQGRDTMMRDAKLAGIKRDLGTMVGHACTTCIGVLTPRGKDEGCS